MFHRDSLAVGGKINSPTRNNVDGTTSSNVLRQSKLSTATARHFCASGTSHGCPGMHATPQGTPRCSTRVSSVRPSRQSLSPNQGTRCTRPRVGCRSFVRLYLLRPTCPVSAMATPADCPSTCRSTSSFGTIADSGAFTTQGQAAVETIVYKPSAVRLERNSAMPSNLSSRRSTTSSIQKG